MGIGVFSETGRLRTVLLHRPGHELRRLTPRNNDALLFDGVPWVDRAQDEHDAFAQVLRDRDVEVLYLSQLLTESLEQPEARRYGIDYVLDDQRLGRTLRDYLGGMLADLTPDRLADVLIAGVRNDEVDGLRSLVTSLFAPDAFLIDPLPNLMFTRDSSVWVGQRPAITSLAMPARERENHLMELIYSHHPRFDGIEPCYGWGREHVEGGDVLALTTGVLAVGVGERTTPAGLESFAHTLAKLNLAHTIVAVPIDQQRAMMHLDTICTMVDVDAVVMYPNIADRLQAMIVRVEDGETTIGETQPFLHAAAQAMGIDHLRVIDTGLDPHTAEREQWDDGNNTLALSPKVCVAYERNVETNARLEAAGIEVVPIAGSGLGTGRGGPPCLSCPITREPT